MKRNTIPSVVSYAGVLDSLMTTLTRNMSGMDQFTNTNVLYIFTYDFKMKEVASWAVSLDGFWVFIQSVKSCKVETFKRHL